MVTERSSFQSNIMLLEDNYADVYLLKRAFRGADVDVGWTVIDNGADGLAFVRRQGAYATRAVPDLAILDLNLPRGGGLMILEAMRQSDDLKRLRVVMMTSNCSAEDRERAAVLGVERIFTKPPELEAFLKLGDDLRLVLLEGVAAGE